MKERKRIGIWLDHKKAVLVWINEKDHSQHVSKIESEIERAHKSTGGQKASRPYEMRSVRAEDRLERRIEQELDHFYDDIISKVKHATHVMLFGPGQAKKELKKRIEENKSFQPIHLDLGSAEANLSEPQMVAKVREHYGVPNEETKIIKKED